MNQLWSTALGGLIAAIASIATQLYNNRSASKRWRIERESIERDRRLQALSDLLAQLHVLEPWLPDMAEVFMQDFDRAPDELLPAELQAHIDRFLELRSAAVAAADRYGFVPGVIQSDHASLASSIEYLLNELPHRLGSGRLSGEDAVRLLMTLRVRIRNLQYVELGGKNVKQLAGAHELFRKNLYELLKAKADAASQL